jgi:hypothetical protein
MRNRKEFPSRNCFGLLMVYGVLLTTPLVAQVNIRESLAGPNNAVNRGASENPYYNLKVGPVSLSFDASVSLEFNDNIGISEKNRVSDIILTPRFGVNANWPVSELNSLNFNLGLGYSKYLLTGNGDSVSALITPGSALSFDVFVGDFRFNFHDRFSYVQDPIDQVTLNNTVDFGRFTNEAGVTVDWDLNDLILTAGYDHVNVWHPQSTFAYLDNTQHNLFGRASLELDPSFTVGAEASLSYTEYDSTRFQNNGAIYNIGPFFRWRASQFLTMQAGGGYTGGLFNKGGLNGDRQSPSGYYANYEVQHKATEYLTHTLSLARSTQFGLNSNYVEVDSVRHSATWRVFPTLTVNTSLFLERAEESGHGPGAENAWRWGGGLGFGHQITEHLNFSMSYNYVQKDSNLLLQDYYQNRVLLELGYRF